MLTVVPLLVAAVVPLGTDLEGLPYPFPVEHLELQIQNQRVRMAYMQALPRKHNGRTVVLLHGKGFCALSWEQTAVTLASRGYRVVMPEQVGFCKSSKPDHFQFSFHQLARNTKAVLDQLSVNKAVIVGHSFGGMLAMRFALRYPDLVEQLILVNPIGLEDYQAFAPHASVDFWYERELGKTRERIRRHQLLNHYHGEWKPQYDRPLDILAGMVASQNYPRLAWNQALVQDMIFTQPVCHELTEIKPPTLFIVGQLDRAGYGKQLIAPELRRTMQDLARDAAEKIPNAELVVLEGIGHIPQIEAHEQFITPLLTFLREH